MRSRQPICNEKTQTIRFYILKTFHKRNGGISDARNFGLLRDNKTGEIISFAPLFDNGLSLFALARKQDYEKDKSFKKTKSYTANKSKVKEKGKDKLKNIQGSKSKSDKKSKSKK